MSSVIALTRLRCSREEKIKIKRLGGQCFQPNVETHHQRLVLPNTLVTSSLTWLGQGSQAADETRYPESG